MQFVMRDGSEVVMDVEIAEGSFVYSEVEGKGEPVFKEWTDLTEQQKRRFLEMKKQLEGVFLVIREQEIQEPTHVCLPE